MPKGGLKTRPYGVNGTINTNFCFCLSFFAHVCYNGKRR
jgi:hypothetical protein